MSLGCLTFPQVDLGPSLDEAGKGIGNEMPEIVVLSTNIGAIAGEKKEERTGRTHYG